MEESEFDDDEEYSTLEDANLKIKELKQIIAASHLLHVESAADYEKTKVVLTFKPEGSAFTSAFMELRKNKPIRIEGLDGVVTLFKAIA